MYGEDEMMDDDALLAELAEHDHEEDEEVKG